MFVTTVLYQVNNHTNKTEDYQFSHRYAVEKKEKKKTTLGRTCAISVMCVIFRRSLAVRSLSAGWSLRFDVCFIKFE